MTKYILSGILSVFLYWLLFGGGELNSPSLGIKLLLWLVS